MDNVEIFKSDTEKLDGDSRFAGIFVKSSQQQETCVLISIVKITKEKLAITSSPIRLTVAEK